MGDVYEVAFIREASVKDGQLVSLPPYNTAFDFADQSKHYCVHVNNLSYDAIASF